MHCQLIHLENLEVDMGWMIPQYAILPLHVKPPINLQIQDGTSSLSTP
jgi:hypothetical protein